jgi:hypothetical protein
MASMDIFKQNPFGMFELTRGLENIPFKPGLLRGVSLFVFRPIRTRQFAIEERNGVLTLIPFSDPDAPPTEANTNGEERVIRDFRTRHLKKDDKVRASEVSGIRAFGNESELTQVMGEVARRGAKLRAEAELTFEFHALNAVQGKVLNPGTNAVVYDWYDAFGLNRPAEIDFDLDNPNPGKGALRKKCFELITAIEADVGGLVPGSLTVEAVCGTSFWRDLTSHPDVIDTYLYAAKTAELAGKPLDIFDWGGIRFRRYRGGSGVAVNTDKAHFYPVGIDGLFEQYASPTEDFDFVNTPGQEVYYRIIPDRDRNAFVKLELEANTMFVCTRPKVLRTGKRT